MIQDSAIAMVQLGDLLSLALSSWIMYQTLQARSPKQSVWAVAICGATGLAITLGFVARALLVVGFTAMLPPHETKFVGLFFFIPPVLPLLGGPLVGAGVARALERRRESDGQNSDSCDVPKTK